MAFRLGRLRPFSGRLRPCTRSFSSTEPSAEVPYQFRYPKAEDLFRRITAEASADDVRRLADHFNSMLGRPIRANEFYYRGFGGRRSAGTAPAQVAAVEEAVKTSVDLKLASFDASAKIKVIKEIRAIAGLGLKEAKELVESAPKVIQKGLKPEQAEELKAKLEQIGATIEIV